MEKLAKNTIWNSAGVLTYYACQWLITVIVVRLSLDYTNAGYLALAISVTNVFATIATYNIRAFQVSDIQGEFSDSEYVATRLLTCAISFLLCVVFVLIAGFSPIQIAIVLCYMVFRAHDAFLDVLHGIYQKKWKMDYIGVSLIVRGVSFLVVFMLLLWLFDLLPAIIGMAVTTILIGLLYDIPKAKKLASFTVYAGKQVISLLKRCFPLMLMILIGMTITSYSKFSVERIYGSEALGIFASVTMPAMIIQVATATLLAPFGSVLTRCLKEGNKQKFTRVFIIFSYVIAGGTALFVVLAYFFGRWALNILYGASILPNVNLLFGAAIGTGLTAFMWLMSWVLTATRDIRGLFFGNMIGLITCVIAIDPLLLRYGVEGANHTIILSMGLAVLCVLGRLFWFLRNRPEIFIKQEVQT